MKTCAKWLATALLAAAPFAASADFWLLEKEAVCGTKNCKIDVEAAEPNIFGCSIGAIKTKYAGAEVDTLKITEKNTVITWELPKGFMFCPVRGDGVFLSEDDPNFQFEADGFDDDKSIKAKGCKKRFRMIGANDNPSDSGKKFKYVIRFRSETKPSTLCERDPWIRNS